MTDIIRGIHHITAIASDPQRTLDFYTHALGLRLVKLTINFDDPGTYHFYFGDEAGRPGTILTFFPWTDVRRGRKGLGQVAVVAFRIPAGSSGFWLDRLQQMGITASGPFTRFDEEIITLLDPDGLQIELAAPSAVQGNVAAQTWEGSPVPAEHAIRGFAGPTLLVNSFEKTAALLSDTFGMRQVAQSGPRCRFSAGEGNGAQVDMEIRSNEMPGRMGAGVVHHIAWRTPSDAQQAEWRETLVRLGFDVTPILDRQYFHSIYFREPGGILFEIATDPPGFATDETIETLGSGLKLPPWLEPQRAAIERSLPPLRLPAEQRKYTG